ncbi:ATP-binding protein [Mucilaginibacter terrae]|uniref:sensor histidine kinase n=1 Tax=Mucilaginibacter terrae TaxID=1955052 RepID=UPI00362CAFCB
MRDTFKRSRFLWSLISVMLMIGLIYTSGYAQTLGNETGIPIQKEFLPADYKASGQNFAITADHRGIMYFANFTGVLEYDGTNWRTILTKERTKVNTLVTDRSGKIYVGTRGEIGYLQPDTLGDMQFVSINSYLKPYNIAFPDVISSYATAVGVYFITANHIILWNGKKLKVQSIANPIISAFYVNTKLYVQLKVGGLQVFNNGRFNSINGGDRFSEQETVNAMVSAGANRVLIGSGNQGLFMLTDKGITPYRSEANAYLKTNLVSYATRLKDGSFVLGTVNGGVVIITADGLLKQIFSKGTTGLYNNNIHFLYEDDNHGFWIATEKNISRIEMPSYLVFYNSKKNVNGNVTGITRFQNKLYIATDQGLFYYNGQQMQFKAVPGLQMPCQHLLRVNNQLLVATSTGVYSFNGTVAQIIVQGYSLFLHQYKSKANMVYAGQLKGVAVLQYNGGKFKLQARLPGITDEIREIADTGNGHLWLQVPSKGLINVDVSNGKSVLYNQSRGLPYNSGNHLNMVGGKLLIGTIKGVYKFNLAQNKFTHTNIFKGDSVTNYTWINQMVEGKAGSLWTTSGNGTDINNFVKTSNGYTKANAILAPVKDQQVFSIFPDDNGTGVWLGSTDNLIFFDTRYAVSFSKVKPALIRSVNVNTDSVLFSGTYFDAGKLVSYNQNKEFTPKLNYQHNNISFTFTSPSSTGSGDMLYKYYLQGFDADTTTWVKQQQKEYSNLPAGEYTFHVQAKNVFGFISREATYRFTITKPFYQTIWAYLIYALVLAVIILLVVRLRSQKLLREKSRLENLIRDRTAEVITQKEAIESQSLELAGKNDELEKINLIVKSINAEINFSNLMQAILEKARIIRGAEKAAMLVYDKATDSFKFKASYGYNTVVLDQIQISPVDAQTRYLSAAEEIYEDIYFVKSVKSIKNDEQLASVNKAKSSLMMVIKLNHQIHAFMIIENWQKRNAFEERDFSLLKNLKEHFVAAVIKTTLLEDIQDTLTNLKDTQEQLIRQEKLASIGQLTKGIVDRILNPLNYINNFSSLSADLIDESIEIFEKPELGTDDKEEIFDLLATVKNNMQKVNDHGSSASRIIKAMERILREKSTVFIDTDINRLVEATVAHVIKDCNKEFPGVNVNVVMKLDPRHEHVMVLPTELNTVLTHLLMNAWYVVAERTLTDTKHQAHITVSTVFKRDDFEIVVRDNGKGISVTEQKQLFSPFFTTKPTARGTGLGLYLSQEIVKEHKGEITVYMEEGLYTEFVVNIPKRDFQPVLNDMAGA